MEDLSQPTGFLHMHSQTLQAEASNLANASARDAQVCPGKGFFSFRARVYTIFLKLFFWKILALVVAF